VSESAGVAALAGLLGMRIGLDMVTGFSVRRTLGSPHFKSFLTAEIAETNAEIAEESNSSLGTSSAQKQRFSLRSQRLKAFERRYSSSG
jgi:hypothetical protein